MTLTDLLLIALAAWRFSYFITKEDGPGNVMGRLRGWAVESSTNFKPAPYVDLEAHLITDAPRVRPGSIGKLFGCLRCASVYGAFLAWVMLQGVLAPIVWIAAGSAAAILLSEYVGVGYGNE